MQFRSSFLQLLAIVVFLVPVATTAEGIVKPVISHPLFPHLFRTPDFRIQNPGSASGPARMSQIRYVKHSILPYLLSVPTGTVPAEGWPLICFLHGYDEAADSAPIRDALTKHGPLNPSNPQRVLDQFIVVAPQMPVAGEVLVRMILVQKSVACGFRRSLASISRRCERYCEKGRTRRTWRSPSEIFDRLQFRRKRRSRFASGST